MPTWVLDEDIWEKAKDAVESGKKEYPEDRFWPVVTTVYKNMGGRVKKKKKSDMENRIIRREARSIRLAAFGDAARDEAAEQLEVLKKQLLELYQKHGIDPSKSTLVYEATLLEMILGALTPVLQRLSALESKMQPKPEYSSTIGGWRQSVDEFLAAAKDKKRLLDSDVKEEQKIKDAQKKIEDGLKAVLLKH